MRGAAPSSVVASPRSTRSRMVSRTSSLASSMRTMSSSVALSSPLQPGARARQQSRAQAIGFMSQLQEGQESPEVGVGHRLGAEQRHVAADVEEAAVPHLLDDDQ